MNNINIGDTVYVYALFGIDTTDRHRELLGIYSEQALAELAWMGAAAASDLFDHHEIKKILVNTPIIAVLLKKGDLK